MKMKCSTYVRDAKCRENFRDGGLEGSTTRVFKWVLKETGFDSMKRIHRV